KGVKTDAYRQDNVQCSGLHRDPQTCPGLNPAVHKKVVVLKKPQQADIGPNTYPQQSLALGRSRGFTQPHPYPVIYQGTQRNQTQKPPVPPAVKYITGQQQQQVLPV